ncbi:MAG: ElyC/SanA/YdcF family protein [Vicinamibacterales bacterium]|jgi:uncharacterized SAM-binding protein YcdF (DUF218 family)/glycosyltransferase involved in cell wall biosynthesis|nr:hypothetical protein [Acidobacteriota bacterium]MDP7671714.1 ElyC/SanA/YdcF family protein [Vicinamibacterales bacterium]HJO39526.1 ElyC/SanA/YdcF family protein [Vicinamibacterales bacterium]|tara:strand:- start:1761 stop:3602 length:1842 start_codon:yes stop_codon:yes gene_type:complete
MSVSRLRGRDIICISSIDWDFNWQGHQEIMATLALQGNRVLFVENTGVRAPKLRDLPRLRQRFLNWWRSTKGFRQERENLFVYSSLLLPFPYSWVARWLNRTLLVRSLRRWMWATGFRRPIIWTFLPTPLVVDLIDRLDPELVVYYCIADFEQLSVRPQRIVKSERRLLGRSDLVFVQGETLRQRCGQHPNVHIFPFGVSMTTFRRDTDVAPELKSLKRPVIGYIGGIHRHVDFDLARRVAQELDATVVFVGPVQAEADTLRQLHNVVFIGSQPHTRMPEFIRGFDVGMIPYRRTAYTESVYPTKLNEYLAMGIPVVATDLPEVSRFAAEHPGVVTVAGDADTFIEGTRRAFEEPSAENVDKRVAVARQNSWEARIAQMSTLVGEALASRAAAGTHWENTLRRLYRSARCHVAWAVLSVAIGYLAVFHTTLPWTVAEPLRIVEEARAADAIVVFAGGVGESGQAGGGYQERVAIAAALYREGHAPNVVFSSGFAFFLKEAEVMRTLAVSLGVSPSAITLEQEAASTNENVTYVREILDRRGWQRILLVSSPYHMRRATLTWRKLAPEVEVVSVPVPQSRFYRHSSGGGASLEQIRGILHEYAAIAFYWWKGWI